MPDPRRHAAALLAVLLFAAPAAHAAQPSLLAQIEDATPTPSAQPPLSEEPPEQLGGGEEDEGEDEGGAGEQGATGGGEREPLPETGLDAGLVALLGLGLIASGTGLRLRLGRGHAV